MSSPVIQNRSRQQSAAHAISDGRYDAGARNLLVWRASIGARLVIQQEVFVAGLPAVSST